VSYLSDLMKKHILLFSGALILGVLLVAAVDSRMGSWLGYLTGFVVFVINVMMMAYIIRLLFQHVAPIEGQQERMKPTVGPLVLGVIGFLKVVFILGALYLSLTFFEMSPLFLALGCFVALSCFVYIVLRSQLQRQARAD